MWRLLVKYNKKGEIRFISHLELVETFKRAIRRTFLSLNSGSVSKAKAAFPILLTSGFTPKMKISWGPPLSLGMESEAEYFEVALREKIPLRQFLTSLSKTLPPGLNAKEAIYISLKAPSIVSLVDATSYEVVVKLSSPPSFPKPKELLSYFWKNVDDGLRTGNKLCEVLKRKLLSLSSKIQKDELVFNLTVSLEANGTLRPQEIIELIFKSYPKTTSYEIINIQREDLYKKVDGKLVDLMDFVRRRESVRET